MKEIRLATIGTGEIVRHILDAVKATPGISLQAVYSRTEEKGRSFAASFGCDTVYTDLDAMLADPDINTVYVASPNSLHYAQTKMALEAGKHVICEKPFCPELWQAEELFALAERNNRMLLEAVPTLFLPNFSVIREHLGEIGRIRLVLGCYTQYSGRYDKLRAGIKTNVFDPAFAGGCLMDLNFYNVYLTLALFGEPLNAVYAPNLCEGIDTSGIACMTYPNFQAALSGAKDARGESVYQIQGEDGFLSVENGPNGLQSLRVVTAAGEETYNLQQNPDRWFYEIQNLVPVFLEENKEKLRELKEITLAVCGTIEKMRKMAGIRFPGDNSWLYTQFFHNL